MSCPVNTVKTRLFHARAKLQKLLPQLANPASAATGATGDAHAGRRRTAGEAVMTASDSRHEESWLLLPWLANGRLPAAERARVEEHVRECEQCAREVAWQRLACQALAEPDRVTYAPGASFRKLMERIDGRPAAPRERPAARVRGLSPRRYSQRGGPRDLPGRRVSCCSSASPHSLPWRTAGRSRCMPPTPPPPR